MNSFLHSFHYIMKIQNVQSDAAFLPTCFLFFIYQRNAARADIGSDDRTDFYIRDCNVTDVRLEHARNHLNALRRTRRNHHDMMQICGVPQESLDELFAAGLYTAHLVHILRLSLKKREQRLNAHDLARKSGCLSNAAAFAQIFQAVPQKKA